MNNVLPAIPDGWRKSYLEDLAFLDREKLSEGTNGTFSFYYIDISAVTEGNLQLPATKISFRGSPSRARKVVRRGDVLMASVRPNLKAFAYFDHTNDDCIASTGFAVLTAKTDVDPRFILASILSDSVSAQIESHVVGSNYPAINSKDIRRLEILAPPPPQQRKIARILTTVDNQIEKTEALIAKYQAIKQGMMHDLFTRGVDEHGHLRPAYEEAPELYKSSELGWIPKEWKTCRVDEVGSVKLGRQRSPKHQSGRFTTPYLRVANVFDGFIDYSDVLEMDFTPTEKNNYSLLPGDVLLNEGQSLELVGRSAIYEGEPHRFCFQNTLIRFRANPPNDPRFCRGIFKFYIDIGRFMTIARQTTSVAHLGADRLAKLAFPRPEPDEQGRIANALLQHEKQWELERAYKVNLEQQKTGLVQDLLTGKVRVKVDDAEEGAAHA